MKKNNRIKTTLKVTNRIIIQDNFLLKLNAKDKFESGDLLAIIPPNTTKERLYSIANINNQIILSIKLYKLGICSTYLKHLPIGSSFEADILTNEKFHCPEKDYNIIMIAVGTGIAPFLGMVNSTNKISFYIGMKNSKIFNLYKPIIENSFSGDANKEYFLALSEDNFFLEDVLKSDLIVICNILFNNGIVMICGSRQLHKNVRNILKKGLKSLSYPTLEFYKSNQQILEIS